jgi:hypothetical protein
MAWFDQSKPYVGSQIRVKMIAHALMSVRRHWLRQKSRHFRESGDTEVDLRLPGGDIGLTFIIIGRHCHRLAWPGELPNLSQNVQGSSQRVGNRTLHR